jgi:DNA-directed RNA polymerase specialized sigma24 family protein
MVAVRIDPRLAARVDPSDVVQETLTEAHRRLDDYLAARPVPFYPWLRQLVRDRLADLHRRATEVSAFFSSTIYSQHGVDHGALMVPSSDRR